MWSTNEEFWPGATTLVLITIFRALDLDALVDEELKR
jgi:hypothetical protein